MGLSPSKPKPAQAALVGQKVPDFELSGVGQQASTTMHGLLAQGKPVVLDMYSEFWGACHTAADEFEQLAAANKDKPVIFAFVNTSGEDGAPGFAQQHGISHALHFHNDFLPVELLINGIPHKMLVAADGTVVRNWDFDGTTLAAEVERLFVARA